MPHSGDELKKRKLRAWHDSLIKVDTNPLSGRNIRTSMPDPGTFKREYLVGHFEYDFDNETEKFIRHSEEE